MWNNHIFNAFKEIFWTDLQPKVRLLLRINTAQIIQRRSFNMLLCSEILNKTGYISSQNGQVSYTRILLLIQLPCRMFSEQICCTHSWLEILQKNPKVQTKDPPKKTPKIHTQTRTTNHAESCLAEFGSEAEDRVYLGPTSSDPVIFSRLQYGYRTAALSPL